MHTVYASQLPSATESMSQLITPFAQQGDDHVVPTDAVTLSYLSNSPDSGFVACSLEQYTQWIDQLKLNVAHANATSKTPLVYEITEQV